MQTTTEKSPTALEQSSLNVTPTTTSTSAEFKENNLQQQPQQLPQLPTPSDHNADQYLKIVDEFQYLLEKSQQLFANLRDLPAFGSHKSWQPHFQRTFEVYTKLWKFQQQYRHVLEDKELYGLKRWEIGEIASKIAQLYYHYYLRTSETNYLHESFIFYEAIRDRSYFKEVLDSKNPALVIKKLRYYARFIVVCLLMNKFSIIPILIEELTFNLDDYVRVYRSSSDAAEWQSIITEINNFVEAEKAFVAIDTKFNAWPVDGRLKSEFSLKQHENLPVDDRMTVQYAVIVGNCTGQTKFSELTLDMFRMLQVLERAPGPRSSSKQDSPKSPTDMSENAINPTGKQKKSLKLVNPQKYLLYKPDFAQLYMYISSAFKELSTPQSAMLVYISADGITNRYAEEDEGIPRFTAGVSTAVLNKKRESENEEKEVNKELPSSTSIECLYPGDLLSFSRKPLFIIIDSQRSVEYLDLPRIFDQPVVCLLSPTEYPTEYETVINSDDGNLFTLFFYSPALAFIRMKQIPHRLKEEQWIRITLLFDETERIIMEIYETLFELLDFAYQKFMEDDFCKRILVRYIISRIVMKMEFKEEKYLPMCKPEMPQSMFTIEAVEEKLEKIADICSTAVA